MQYDEELSYILAKEISNLWFECKIRCEKIEEIIKQINEKAK
jgi:hypothetical protein